MYLAIKKASQETYTVLIYPTIHTWLSTVYWFSRHSKYKPVIKLLHLVLSSSLFLKFTRFRHKRAKAHCGSDSPQVGLSEWGLQWAATKSQNQLVTICMYTLKEKPIKRAMLQFTSSQLLKRIPKWHHVC